MILRLCRSGWLNDDFERDLCATCRSLLQVYAIMSVVVRLVTSIINRHTGYICNGDGQGWRIIRWSSRSPEEELPVVAHGQEAILLLVLS